MSERGRAHGPSWRTPEPRAVWHDAQAFVSCVCGRFWEVDWRAERGEVRCPECRRAFGRPVHLGGRPPAAVERPRTLARPARPRRVGWAGVLLALAWVVWLWLWLVGPGEVPKAP